MRAWALAILAAALVGAAAAQTEDDPESKGWRPQFIASAKPDEIKAAFPKAAYDQKITGEVTLACVARADGKLNACEIHKETPAGLGFGEAALTLVGKERIKTKDAAGASVAGRPVKTHFQFLAPGDSNPQWVRKPSSADLAGVFPTAAVKANQDGRAAIKCDITVEGFLQNCKVVSEDPVGLGFGQAGLQLAPQFRMSPKIRGGKAMTSQITVPIVWAGLSNGGLRPTGQSLVMDPPWLAAPTTAEVAAAWPAEAGALPSGQAVLRCDLNKAGGLTSCDVISENPKGKGFGKAAKTLSKTFKVSFGASKSLDDYKIDVPFRFRNPATPDTRKLTKPNWIRTLSPEGMADIYPAAAIKAGVKSGLGVVSCVANALGELTDCQATREDPAGLDFSAAAIQAAGVMRMNPWTKEGDPVEGLRITLPVRFEWQDPSPKAADAPAAKP
jgi:TonB family protein